jgi:hypothetical protein
MVRTVCLFSVAALAALIQLEGETQSADQNVGSQPLAKYVVCAAPKQPSWGPDLVRMLRGKYGATSAVESDELEKAIASPAEVLILVLPDEAPSPLSTKSLETLKKRKIIGIGKGAAELFDQMRLEIGEEQCAGGEDSRLTVGRSILFNDQKRVEKDTITGAAKDSVKRHNPATREIQVEAPGSAPDPGSQVRRNLTISVMGDPNQVNAAETSRRILLALDHPGSLKMFIPTWSPYSSVVDAIARSTDDPLYAPIVRQGNCVLVGLTVPPARWSPTYAEFFCQLCQKLSERQREQFSTVRWPVTSAGKYEFKLAGADQTERASMKWFFFEFKAPTTITARLSFRGSKSVSMVFSGKDRAHWERNDSNDAGTANHPPPRALELSQTIDRNDVDRMDGPFWELLVTNYDQGTSADCTLSIEYARPKK